MNAPSFLTRKAKQEPTVTQLPQRQVATREATMEFLDSVDRLREECTYLRTENEQLNRELRLANERLHVVTTELDDVKRDKDFLLRHDASMLNALRIIKTVINDQEESARAEAFAPPGTGQQTQHQALTEQDENALAEIVATIKPEPLGNA